MSPGISSQDKQNHMKNRVPRQSIGIFRSFAPLTLLAASAVISSTVAAAQAPSYLPTVITFAGNHTSGNTGNNGLAINAELNTPAGSTIDPNGNIYICDTKNNVIRKVDARTGIITTIAGNGVAGYISDGVVASTTEINAPNAVRYYQGGLWIADFGNNRIRRVDLTTGIITTMIGGGVSSVKNASPSLPGTSLKIYPNDLAFDSLGNMYWSEANGASRVNVYNIATGIAQIFAGTGGTASATGTNVGTATSSLTQPEETIMNGPFGLAVDAQNNVYVNETATGVIRKITVGAVPVETTYAGIGIGTGAAICVGATDSVGDGCPATTASSTVTTGVTGAQFAHGSGTTFGHFSIDGNGTLYLADGTDNRVRVIPVNPSNPTVGGIVTTIAGNSVTADSADGSYAQESSIGNPYDAQVLPTGDLLITERNINSERLLHLPGAFPQTAIGAPVMQTVNVLTQAVAGVFTVSNTTDFTVGLPTCVPGVGVTGFVCTATVTFTPTLAGLRQSALTFTDANGSAVAGIFGIGVAPAASLLPGLTSTLAGTGTAGATGDGAAATSATLNMPGATAVDGQGNLYIADTANNEVRKVTPGGTITRIAGTGAMGSSGDGAAATAATLNAPAGVAVDPAGNVYISDTGNNKVRIVTASNGNISTVAGTGTAGYTGDQSVPAAATLNGPTQLAWGSTGVLYVADTGNSAIRAIAPGESLITTVAGSANPGFGGDAGPGQAAQLQNPHGVAVDTAGNVYIADTGNNRVRELSEGDITTLAGQQGGGYIGDGLATATELNAPTGVGVDTAGDVYIADTLNQRIRLIAAGQIYTVAGTGTVGATGDGGTSALATLSGPTAVALDSLGNLYIADTGNNKVRGITVAMNSLQFKTQNPTETSPPQTVSLFNSGNQALALTSVTVPMGYIEAPSATGVDCISAPLTIAVGGGCNLNTEFNPPTIGTYNGTITLSDNAQNVGTATQTIAVQATSAFVFTATLTLPGTATAGTAVSGLLTVKNPQVTYTGTVKFTSTDPQATIPANYTFMASDNGTHMISVTYKTAGPQCVTATDTTDPTVTSTACTKVSASVAAKITVHSGNSQTANISTAYPQKLIAAVTDTYGNPVQNASVVFTIVPGAAATGTFANAAVTETEVSDLSGYASSTTITSGPTIGSFTVTAALSGTTSTTPFTLNVVILGSFTIVPDSTQVGPVSQSVSSMVGLTITGTSGFNAPVALTCSAPSGTTCSVSPPIIPFNNGVETGIRPVLIFQTAGNLLGAGITHGWPLAVLTLLSLLVFGRRRRLGALLVAGVALFAIGSATGCGTGYAPTTPNGNYTVTVTGTAQTVSASTMVTFTVQN
jgi:sugar lactone lactonase YvrE